MDIFIAQVDAAYFGLMAIWVTVLAEGFSAVTGKQSGSEP